MIVTIDIGNSNIVVVVYDKKQHRVVELREETKKDRAKEYYRRLLQQVKSKIPEKVEGVIIASVVPKITNTVLEISSHIFKVKPFHVTVGNIPEFVVHLDNPDELGADFIATAYGVIAKKKYPAVIADMGSATKLSVIDENRQFSGGVIIPGVQVASEALVHFIPHLPEIELKLPKEVIGHDTISAMQSGLLYGVIGSLEGIANRIEKQVGHNMYRFLTGGYANIVFHEMPEFDFEPYLLNEGLYYLYTEKKVKYER
jgi:type III pantothenate kinase